MKSHIFGALTEKSFVLLWLGEIFTQIAINLFNFFLILVVFKATESNTAVSGIVLSFTIPAIIFGSLAGAYVDRRNKKQILIITNIVRAAFLILLAFYLDNLVMIYVISFFVSILTQFFIPAETPMIPLVVKKKHLLSANALFSMAIYGSILVAYVLSGPMLIHLQEVKTLLVLSVLMLLGAGIISFIKPGNPADPTREIDRKLNIFRDIRHTFSLMSQTRALYGSLFMLALSQSLILIVATIAPGYATQVLSIPVEEFPVLFVAPAALGTIIGSVVMVNVFHSHPKEKVITFGIFLSAFAMFMLPFGSKVASRDFVQVLNASLPHIFDITIMHIMVVLAFILGFANALVFVPANTILQEKTTDEFRGKIYGFLNSIVGAFSLFPVILVGGLSDIIGVGAVLVGIGVSLLVLGLVRLVLD